MTKEQIKTLEAQLTKAMKYAADTKSTTGYFAASVIATLLAALYDPQGLIELVDETTLHSKRVISRLQKETALQKASKN